ncbi:MAG: anaerobic ribonucleoside-triphosphate reductase activating protein [Clostridia bacterium]|nr:anaerobic ribonucleoside-triphosphate reductase activating protein [Clostridia bacterium]
MAREIKIAGWQKVSLIDYPEKIASVIFIAGCNMCCHYCHNHHILDSCCNQIPLREVLDELRKRKNFLDAVVVSGGEPTVYPFLIPLLRQLRTLDLLIKLDTNGTRPQVLKKVIELGLVDYVALDIKAPQEQYVAMTGMPIDEVLVSLNYLKQQKRVPYMLRTTLSPRLSLDDMVAMGKKLINGATIWQIQQCRVAGAYSVAEVRKIVSKLQQYAVYIVVKGV